MATLIATNDDGISSKLFMGMVQRLRADGHRVLAIAPSADQSWIGTAHSAKAVLTPKLVADDTYELDGTPCDCTGVAIAMLKDSGQTPDAVVSGINIGVNTRLPLVVTSGTVAGATAGAMMGYRAIAFSYAMPREFSAAAKQNGGVVPQTQEATAAMFGHISERIGALLAEDLHFGLVYNVNFPPAVNNLSQWEECCMSLNVLSQGFVRQEDGSFKLNPRFENTPVNQRTEFDVIGEGKIAQVSLEFDKIG